MPDLSLLKSPAPYHLISYGTLLGSQVFQSFIGGIVAYRALPRPQFSSLQQAIFPVYFSMQAALPVILALTYPGERTAIGSRPSSLSGVLEQQNRLHVLTPLLTMLVTSLANLMAVGPATTRIMKERKHQETRDGKRSYDAGPHSKEMQILNQRFGRMHGVSSLLNMAGGLATVWYGMVLAERLQ
ncbi:hypothetical protein EPUS_08078 [Endocarpon pusillum Z07020]|uniref:TMEM205-like domain-containing protein n=1 Tax=Endocarpon pusillum (strain Z07020 / HMAS-L-300199) TaxID=1263415 RepID=U1GA74_ENDPU|nr:uncharacterized protein EPUS_08078 [Endocarpon pusillum Z07020]ERF68918.1 hypothetical protein EPUS_08078 [Endocarpon pusillum Z07020]